MGVSPHGTVNPSGSGNRLQWSRHIWAQNILGSRLQPLPAWLCGTQGKNVFPLKGLRSSSWNVPGHLLP